MRSALACLLVAALAGSAAADAKIKDLIRGYQREAGSCQKNARGIRVVIERGRPVSGNDTELADDLSELAKAQGTVQGHCDQLESTLELLSSNPRATYKQLQKQIEDHDKDIRAGRAASRQALAEAEPRIARSVVRINKLIATADAAARPSTREQQAAAQRASGEDKAAAERAAAEKAAAEKAAADKAAADKATAKKVAAATTAPAVVEQKVLSRFPSGRSVELPAPAEAWTVSGRADTDVADYAFAGAKATVLVRRHAGALTCDQIRTSLALAGGRTSAQAADAGAELESLRPAWVLAWSEGDTRVRVVCVQAKDRALVGRTEASVAGNPPLATAVTRMLAANLKR
jgi:hypothetical protein